MEDDKLWVNVNTFPIWGNMGYNPCREIPINYYVASVDVANDSDVSAINIWRRHLTDTPNMEVYIERTASENYLDTLQIMHRTMSLDFNSLYPSLQREIDNYNIFDDFTYTPFDDYLFRHSFTDDWLYYP